MTLSRREQEVCDLFNEGLTYRQIGQRLGISPGTVRIHRSHARDKGMALPRRRSSPIPVLVNDLYPQPSGEFLEAAAQILTLILQRKVNIG